MRRRGQASIIGSILFFVLFAAAMAGVASYASSQSQASGAANRAQSLNAQKGSEQLTYGALSSGALTIQNTGSSATSLVEVIIKYANGTVYTASPSTSSLAANNLLQVGQLVPSTAAGSMTLQARYNAILSSTNSADQIGLVTSRGNTFWLKPAVASQTNPNLSYGITFSASGASAFGSSTVLTVDTASYTNSQLPITLTWFTGTKHTYAWQTLPQGTGTRVGAATTGLTTATSGTLTVTSPGTVQATYTTQYLLTLTGGSGVATSPASPTGDGYYSSGTSVQVTVPNAWGTVTGQSRSNLASYSLDGSSPTAVTRSGSGNFVYSLTMGAPHTVAFNTNTQYYLTVTGGNGVAYGTASPTGDNWYDSGSSTTVSSNWVWGTVTGQSRTAIQNWQLDTVNQNPARSGTGTLTTSAVTMSTYHTVALTSNIQYYLTVAGGTAAATLSSQTSDSWYDSGTNAQATSGYAWNTVSGQSRSNLYSWQVDGGVATTVSRAASGTFTSSNVAMSTYHTVTFNPVTQYYLTASGGANLVYANSQTSDGWYDAGTSIASVTTNYVWSVVTGQSRQTLLSYQVDSGASTSVTRASSGTYSTASITMSTYHTVTFNGQLQYAVSAVGGNSVTCASTPFNDCWGDSGSTATATTNYVWSVVAGQSRLNLISWNLDGGTNAAATRAGSGTFTTTSVTINNFHTINFNSVTQYYLTVSGGNGIVLSGSQTSDNWVDSGGAVTVTTNYAWNSNGYSRLNLVSWNLDGGANQAVTRAGSGTFTTTSVTMSTYHAINFNSLTQYYVTFGSPIFSGSISAPTSYCGTLNTGPVSPGPNSASYSISGGTVTYTYQIGNGCTSTWAWANLPEPYSGNSCTSLGLNGNTQVQVNPPGCLVRASSSGTNTQSIGASPTSDGWYDSGSSVSLTATTSGPFSFTSWSASSGGLMIAGSSSASTSVTVNGGGTITPNINVGY